MVAELIRRGVVTGFFVIAWFWLTVVITWMCWVNDAKWALEFWVGFVLVTKWTAALTGSIGLVIFLDDLYDNAPKIECYFTERRKAKQEALQKRTQEQERLLRANGIDF